MKLKDVAQVKMGQSPDSKYYNTDGFGYPFLQGCGQFGKTYPDTSIYCSTPTRIAPSGSILFSVRAPVGEINIADQDYCIGRGLAAVEARGIDNRLLYYLLLTARPQLTRIAQGSTFEAISSSDLANCPIPDVGDMSAQTAIAEILATVDRAIEQTEALIAKQRRINAGLLHDLLTRGIDEQGNLRDPATHRFKQSALGLIPEEWEVTVLSAKCSRITDGVHMSFPKGDGNIPFLFVSCIKDGKILWNDASTITDSIYQLISQGRTPVRGLVLYTIVGSYGNAAVVTDDRRFSFQRHIGYLLPQFDVLQPEYLAVWLNSERAKRIADATAIGNAQKTITLGQLDQFPLLFPSFEEQNRIVEALGLGRSQTDRFVEQLGKLHRLKTGLMQDLLSGRVSVAGLAEGGTQTSEVFKTSEV